MLYRTVLCPAHPTPSNPSPPNQVVSLLEDRQRIAQLALNRSRARGPGAPVASSTDNAMNFHHLSKSFGSIILQTLCCQKRPVANPS